MRSRPLWLLLVLILGWVVWDLAADGSVFLAVGYGAIVAGFAWWIAPWRGRGGLTHTGVQNLADSDSRKCVVIYWRPGCGYCSRLRARLGAARKSATWINIWGDEPAAEFVRSVNDGNEIVPTVVIDGTPHTNPSPDLVRDRLTTA